MYILQVYRSIYHFHQNRDFFQDIQELFDDQNRDCDVEKQNKNSRETGIFSSLERIGNIFF